MEVHTTPQLLHPSPMMVTKPIRGNTSVTGKTLKLLFHWSIAWIATNIWLLAAMATITFHSRVQWLCSRNRFLSASIGTDGNMTLNSSSSSLFQQYRQWHSLFSDSRMCIQLPGVGASVSVCRNNVQQLIIKKMGKKSIASGLNTVK